MAENYELASVNIAVMLSFRGVGKQIKDTMDKIAPQINKSMNSALTKAIKDSGIVISGGVVEEVKKLPKKTKKPAKDMADAMSTVTIEEFKKSKAPDSMVNMFASEKVKKNMAKVSQKNAEALLPTINSLPSSSKKSIIGVGQSLGVNTLKGFQSVPMKEQLAQTINDSTKTLGSDSSKAIAQEFKKAATGAGTEKIKLNLPSFSDKDLKKISNQSKMTHKLFNKAADRYRSAMDSKAGAIIYKAGFKVSDGIKKSSSVLNSTFEKTGKTLSSTAGRVTSRLSGAFKTGAKVLTGAGAASVAGITAAVGSQVIGGGLSRSLSLNESNAKLRAMGLSAEKVENVMNSASEAVDGTGYSLDASAGTATQLLSAGFEGGEEMTHALKQITKLSDISGSSFEEMGTIISRAAVSGTLYAEDLNQVNDRGVAIYQNLADVLNTDVQGVKKLASEGKVSFGDFQEAIDNINFDSVQYGTENAKLAFGSFRSQLAKIGADLWDPITSAAAPFFMSLRDALKELQTNESFIEFTQGIKDSLGETSNVLVSWAENFREFTKDPERVGAFLDNIESGFSAVNNILTTVTPIIGAAIQSLSNVASSEPAQGAIGVIVKTAEYIAGNQALIVTGLGFLVTFITVKKVAKIATSLKSLFGLMNVKPKTKPAKFGNILASIGKAIMTGIAGVGKAVIASFKYIAAFSAFVLLIGGITWALNKMGFFETMKNVALGFVEVISVLVDEFIKVGALLLYHVENVFRIISEHILEVIPIIANAFATVVTAIAGGIVLTLGSVGDFVTILSTAGASAAVNGLALAGSLLALSVGIAAIVAAGTMNSVGGFVGGLFGNEGSNPLTEITELIQSLSNFNTFVQDMPNQWLQTSNTARIVGMQIMNSLRDGMVIGLNLAEVQVKARLQSILNGLQGQLNAQPLEIKVNTPNINSNALNGNTARSSGSTSITNMTYNMSVRNTSTVEKILEKGMR